MRLVKDTLCREETPYEVFHLSMEAKHHDILKAIKDNLKQIGAHKAQSESRRLRLAEERTVVDLLYHLDEEAFKGIEGGWQSPDVRSYVIEKSLDKLIHDKASWMETHALAVASLWGTDKLSISINDGKDIFRTWDIAVGIWVKILYSEDFWKEWLALRCPVYEVEPEKIPLSNIRDTIIRYLRERLLKWANVLPVETGERLSAIFDFELKCRDGLNEVVFPFIKYAYEDKTLPDYRHDLLLPTFASLCHINKVIDWMTDTIRSAKPEKGRIPRIRWQHAVDQMINLKLGLLPAVRPMIALVKANHLTSALAYGEKIMPSVRENPEEDAATRYTAALAFIAKADEALAGGARAINQVLDNQEQALLILNRIEAKYKESKSILITLLLEQIPEKRKRLIDDMVENSLNAAKSFQEAAPEGNSAGISKALNTLLKVYRILNSTGQQNKIENNLPQSIAYLYINRCTINIENREVELALEDLKAARRYDPNNPTLQELLSLDSKKSDGGLIKKLLDAEDEQEKK